MFSSFIFLVCRHEDASLSGALLGVRNARGHVGMADVTADQMALLDGGFQYRKICIPRCMKLPDEEDELGISCK